MSLKSDLPEKIQKLLSRAGVGSRREIERLIEQGQVVVDGKPATLGMRITGKERIKVSGKPVNQRSMQQHQGRVLILNKPEGTICSTKDPEGRKTVFELIPKLARGRWVVVGRLDFNTSGLLLFTDDGELANALMHPSTEVEREYSVRVMGEIEPAVQRKMTEGVVLEDGPAGFDYLTDGGGAGLNHWYNVVLKEGRNREVRRIFESLDVQVSRLIRVRYGSVTLPRDLRQGKYRYLEPPEIRQIYKSVGLKAAEHSNGSDRQTKKFRKTISPQKKGAPPKNSGPPKKGAPQKNGRSASRPFSKRS